MKNIIATTAMALMLSTSAYATDNAGMLKTYQAEQTGDFYASDFIGMRVYATEKDWATWDENTRVKADGETEWDDIGEVNDVILGRDGSVKAVILGIGGFVGIGEKDVAVTMDQIKMVQEEGDSDDFFLVVNTNKDMLTEAEPYRTAATDKAMASADTKAEKMATETTRTMLPRPAVEREGYRVAEPAELTAEVLDGARVYGSEDEDIGEIDRLILDDQGKIKMVVIDVGGFIGIGEHPVGVTFDELQILRTDGGDDFRVYIDSDQKALEAQPAYKS